MNAKVNANANTQTARLRRFSSVVGRQSSAGIPTANRGPQTRPAQLDCFVIDGIDSIGSWPLDSDPMFGTCSSLRPFSAAPPTRGPRGPSPLPLRGRVCGQLVSPYPRGALSLRARLPFFIDEPDTPPSIELPGMGMEPEPGAVRCRLAPTRSS